MDEKYNINHIQKAYDKEFNPSLPGGVNKHNTKSSKINELNELRKIAQSNNKISAIKYVVDKSKQIKSKNKKFKKMPIIVVGVILIIMFMVITILSPAMLITQIARDFTEKANPNSTAMTTRLKEQIIESVKNNNQNTKYRGFGNLTDSFKQQLVKQGIVFKDDKMIYNNEEVNESNIERLIFTDPKFNHIIEQSSNIKRLAFQDSIWKQNANELNIKQSGYNSNNKNDIKQEEIDYTKLNSQFRFKLEDQNIPSEVRQNLTEINKKADDLEKNKKSSNNADLDNIITVDKDKISKTGVCGLYQTDSFNSVYNKTDRLTQASRIAAQIVSVGEKIKAGEASKAEIEFLGNRLVKSGSFKDDKGVTIQTDSATDSYSYRVLSGDENNTMDYSAKKYVAGANSDASKTMQLSEKYFNSIDDKAAKAVCNINTGISVLDGFFSKLANLLVGYNANDASEIEATLNSERSRMATENTIDAMTGLSISPDIYGEDLLNMAYAGWTNLTERSAGLTGAPILNIEQKIAYSKEENKLLTLRSEYDRQTKSPLDISSPNTLLGSFVYKIAPKIAKISTIPNIIFDFKNSINSAIINILPTSKAGSDLSMKQSLEMCKDPEINKINPNIAANHMCIPNRGVDVKYLRDSPTEIIEQLIAKNDLKIQEGSCDENGLNCSLEPINNFKKYIEECVNNPALQVGVNDNGKKCFADDDMKSLYATYLYDQRVLNIINKNIISNIENLWPVDGYTKISSPYGARKDPITGVDSMHYGIDIPAPIGTKTISLINGTAKLINNGGCGLGVLIKNNKYELKYCHLSKQSIQDNQIISSGDKIGEIGSTGYSTGPHLHFEIKVDGENIDPLTILNKQ